MQKFHKKLIVRPTRGVARVVSIIRREVDTRSDGIGCHGTWADPGKHRNKLHRKSFYESRSLFMI